MKVDLSREDLINLVKGSRPNYNVIGNEIIEKCGSFYGNYGRWDWNYGFSEDLTEQQLWDMYVLCRDSWN